MDTAGKEAVALEGLTGCQPVKVHCVFVVFRAAGHVQVQTHAVFNGHGHFGAHQVFRVVDIGRMWTKPRDDAAIGGALAFDESGSLGQLLLAPLRVAKLDDAIGDDGTQAALAGRGRDLVGEKVLVAEGRGARERHLRAGQGDSRTDI